MDLINETIAQYMAQSYLEWIAVFLGISYILLIRRENPLGWVAAFFATGIYTYLFWEHQLPMQSLLHLYYFGMAVFGFYLWYRPADNSDKPEVHIRLLPVKNQLQLLVFATSLSLMAGYYLSTVENTSLPYMDAFISIFAVVNTYLIAKKYLQAWLYWVVIDSFSISLYYQKGFYVTMVLMALYVVLAAIAYIEWKKRLKVLEQENNLSPSTLKS
jgi:nicotinamide mononucleotide transporter